MARGSGDNPQMLTPLEVTAAAAPAVTVAELSLISPLPGAIVQPGQPITVQVAPPAGVQLTELVSAVERSKSEF